MSAPFGASLIPEPEDEGPVPRLDEAPETVWELTRRVQGEGAAEEIVRGIRNLNRVGGVDVTIVGRSARLKQRGSNT